MRGKLSRVVKNGRGSVTLQKLITWRQHRALTLSLLPIPATLVPRRVELDSAFASRPNIVLRNQRASHILEQTARKSYTGSLLRGPQRWSEEAPSLPEENRLREEHAVSSTTHSQTHSYAISFPVAPVCIVLLSHSDAASVGRGYTDCKNTLLSLFAYPLDVPPCPLEVP